jgi:chemotaxis family two-component system response regulator Rcp1
MIRILLIEDNPADVDLLLRAFKSARLDCELTLMEDGAEAMSFVRGEGPYAETPPPDLVVLDLNLPKNDGIEVLQAMRATPQFSAVPVAILSSSSSPRERARVEQFHIGRFITKPPDLDEFLQIGSTLKSFLSSLA